MLHFSNMTLPKVVQCPSYPPPSSSGGPVSGAHGESGFLLTSSARNAQGLQNFSPAALFTFVECEETAQRAKNIPERREKKKKKSRFYDATSTISSVQFWEGFIHSTRDSIKGTVNQRHLGLKKFA